MKRAAIMARDTYSQFCAGIRWETTAILLVSLCGILIGFLGSLCLAGSQSPHCSAPSLSPPLPVLNGTVGNTEDSFSTALGLSLVVVSCATVLPVSFMFILGHLQVVSERTNGFRFLYLQRFLSAWGDRMWEFAVPIVFIDIFKDTLLPTSLYILTINLVVFQFLPSFGSWIDHDDRLRVQQISLVMENVCVVTGAAIICAVTAASSEASHSLNNWQTVIWYVALLVLGSVGELFNSTTVISIDKDWVVAIAKDSHAPLQELNTKIRRIDLVCKAASPAVFAVLYQAYGTSSQVRVIYGAGMVGLWNLISFPIEFALVRLLYRKFIALGEKTHAHSNSQEHSHRLWHKEHFHVARSGLPEDSESIVSRLIIPKTAVVQSNPTSTLLDPKKFIKACDDDVETLHGTGEARVESSKLLDSLAIEDARRMEEPPAMFQSSDEFVLLQDGYELVGPQEKKSQCCGVVSKFVAGTKTYTSQDIFLASVSFTMIFMTVLDNGGLFTSYLEWSKVGTTWIGAGRGAGAVIGLIGTFLYPCLTRSLSNSVPASGLFSLWAFWINLLPIGVVLLLGQDLASVVPYTLLICVSSSRAFLWMFDLSNVELIQTSVADSERGTVSSMQTSLSQFFLILVNLCGVVSPDPRNFHWLVVMSLCVVLSAALLYTFWFARSRCSNS